MRHWILNKYKRYKQNRLISQYVRRTLANVKNDKISVPSTYAKFREQIDALHDAMDGKEPASTLPSRSLVNVGNIPVNSELRVLKVTLDGIAQPVYTVGLVDIDRKHPNIPVRIASGVVVPYGKTRQDLLAMLDKMVSAFDKDIIAGDKR
jgi:hypothetical protein